MQLSQQIVDFVSGFLKNFKSENMDTELLDKWMETRPDLENIINNSPKKSSIKDPNKPKQGRTAYIYFCIETRKQIKSDEKDLSSQEIMKELGKRWKKLKESSDPDDLEYIRRLNKMSSDDKLRYAKDMEQYKPPTIEEIEITNIKRKRTTSSNKKPKNARNAYIFFCAELRPKVKEKYKISDNQEVLKNLSRLWAEFKADDELEDEYERFREMARKDKERYQKEIEIYNLNEEDLSRKISGDSLEKTKKKRRLPTFVLEATKNKPGLAFNIFCDENRKSYERDHPDASEGDIKKLLAKEWKNRK